MKYNQKWSNKIVSFWNTKSEGFLKLLRLIRLVYYRCRLILSLFYNLTYIKLPNVRFISDSTFNLDLDWALCPEDRPDVILSYLPDIIRAGSTGLRKKKSVTDKNKSSLLSLPILSKSEENPYCEDYFSHKLVNPFIVKWALQSVVLGLPEKPCYLSANFIFVLYILRLFLFSVP